MHNQLSERFGIEFPIFAFTHCRDVAAAVSKAGGLGVLGAIGHSPEELDVDLRWIRDQIGDRPVGVDVIVPAKFEGKGQSLSVADVNALIPAAHREFVNDLLARYDVPAGKSDRATAAGNAPAPFSPEQAFGLLEVAFAHKPALVANALGPPPPAMIEMAHDRGIPVAALAGAPNHAERHVAAGVDLIVAQGTEAGGHTGDIATMVLVPEIVDAVAPVPVLAAGGIGRGRQIAAAMALGAQGVWCGSVWLATEEAETHPTVKEKFLKATSADTLRSRSRTGKPARQLRSAWTDAWEAPAAPPTLPNPVQMLLAEPAMARIANAAHDPNSGAAQLANYFVGQIVGSLNQVKPVDRVVMEMVEEYIDTVQGMAGSLEDA
ncbi:NAD(P)H-dependent flavin oxidoreductase [[Mycobacterium] nativiensis]|uniref:Nitronate monooxygenase family protein n=1 Tax=[Mycobacterium] nativiensis TaxID=2855503 RepID=A0ABU5XV44_9MYCO|nr:nitronate monooxygenase family protein [Mycolicibacter sp. MYC340]MEB3031861.1 nitronate monooxygenase family protein [Mycolicibacter sp. MYC340]